MKTIQSFIGFILIMTMIINWNCKKGCNEGGEPASPIDSTMVPQVVRDSFQTQYPTSTATWYLEGTDYEAAIYLGGVKTTLIYLANGSLQQIETEIATSALPPNILTKVQTDYSGFTIKTAATIHVLATGTVKYEAEVQKSDAHYDLIYDSNGTLLEMIDLCGE